VGLVDEIGGLHDAIAEAALLAKLDHYEILKLPVEETPFSMFIQDIDEQAQSFLVKTFLGEDLIPVWQEKKRIERISRMQETQLIMPFELNIE